MPQLREEADADRTENYVEMTDFKTEQNRFELFCASCGKQMYVDKETSDRFTRALEQDLDNWFLCLDCEREQDDMAYAAH